MRMHERMRMLLAVGIGVGIAATAFAFPRFADSTKKSCATCHTGVAGGVALTDAGKAYKADPTKVPAANVAGASYVSNAKCKMCHMVEYKSWLATPHAQALATLHSASAEQVHEFGEKLGAKVSGPCDKAEACLSCHVTGHGQPGGYPGADSLKAAALSGVTCESCHGPGSKHVAATKDGKKAAINGHPSEIFCRQCHTPAMSPKFDFVVYKAKGLHEKKVAP